MRSLPCCFWFWRSEKLECSSDLHRAPREAESPNRLRLQMVQSVSPLYIPVPRFNSRKWGENNCRWSQICVNLVSDECCCSCYQACGFELPEPSVALVLCSKSGFRFVDSWVENWEVQTSMYVVLGSEFTLNMVSRTRVRCLLLQSTTSHTRIWSDGFRGWSW